MGKRNVGSMMKSISLALLVVALCFGPSCKKQDPTPAPAPQQSTTQTPAQTDAPSTAAQVADAVTEKATEVAAAAKEEVKAAVEEIKEAVKPAGDMAPLEIKLPKPMFVGTPQDTRVPNLRKPTGKARPPFLAPAGCKLLSLNKPVSASDEEPIIGDIAMITDGDKEAGAGSFVELGPLLQHVTIDLQARHAIYGLRVWHYHQQPCVCFDVVIQVAKDPNFAHGVKTIFNNDMDSSAGLGAGQAMHYVETHFGELFDAKGIRGRYVRLYSRGNTINDLNYYTEVEVYGRPVR